MKNWWKDSVVYEIYVKSFQDSNHDGIGDLRGIIERLDYLKYLGADVLWLTPIYESPNDDNGYDISDYQKIMELYGTMDDFEELLNQAHKKGLKIVMDLVVNHTSDEHPWFVESRKSTNNSYRDYYIWRDGKDGKEPNNWTNCFLGSAWEYDKTSNQYYLHMFSKKQPDLNWKNPTVRKEVYQLMKYWLDKGIDGFRMDVISLISKDENALYQDSDIKGHSVCANGPFVHEYLKEMNKEVLSHYDIMTVGETPAVTVQEAARFAGEDTKELNMIFQFELMDVDGGESGKWNDTRYQLKDVKQVLSKWQKGLYQKAWNSLFWNNHDQPRVVNRFGDVSTPLYWEKSAKMLATALYMLQGTPYIYQGEEIGMMNIMFPDIKDYRDIESIQAYDIYVRKEKSISHEDMMHYLHKASRDNARTPMQWSKEDYAGFSDVEPWIMVSPDYDEINVEKQIQDETSILQYYRKLLKFRKGNEVIIKGRYEELMEKHPALFAYRRTWKNEELIIICNFSKDNQSYNEIMVKNYEKVLGNYDDEVNGYLRAYECGIWKIQ